jgi:hypothetical protein
MIPLSRTEFPPSTGELALALDEALRRYVPKPGTIVQVSSRVFPYIDEIAINIDRAKLDSLPAAPAPVVGETKLAFEAGRVTLSARNVTVHGVPMDARMELRDVVFDKGLNEGGEVTLLVKSARDGQLVISAAQLELEEAILKIGGAEARRNGIAIEQVRLAMRARGRRSIAADIRIQARKLLLRAKIDIYGQLDIDQDFTTKISQLKCNADGAIGSLACNAIRPFFDEVMGSSFSLKSLPLGEMEIRDLHVAVADTIAVTVDFGRAD